jgi:hypothetical protein
MKVELKKKLTMQTDKKKKKKMEILDDIKNDHALISESIETAIIHRGLFDGWLGKVDYTVSYIKFRPTSIAFRAFGGHSYCIQFFKNKKPMGDAMYPLNYYSIEKAYLKAFETEHERKKKT